MLVREGGLRLIQSTAAGQVSGLGLEPGDVVHQGQVIARLTQQDDPREEHLVTSLHDGRVLEVRARRGDVIQAGAELASVEPSDLPLEAVLYIPAVDAKKVRAGMDVQISPATVPQETYGRLLGRVVAVGQFPASIASMRRVLGNDDLARVLSNDGTPIEVHVELRQSATTLSGYAWTSTLSSSGDWLSMLAGPRTTKTSATLGPTVTLESGTLCRAVVVLDEQAPITLFFARLHQPGQLAP